MENKAWKLNKQAYDKYHQGDFEGALIDAEVAIRLMPHFGAPYHNRGYIKLELADTRKDNMLVSEGIDDLCKAESLGLGESDYLV